MNILNWACLVLCDFSVLDCIALKFFFLSINVKLGMCGHKRFKKKMYLVFDFVSGAVCTFQIAEKFCSEKKCREAEILLGVFFRH